jgi:hypothetical protein
VPGNVSGFTSSQPSGQSSIRHGDDLIRSDKSILGFSLDYEHFFDPVTSASSLSGGVHRPGSARVFTGTRASLATPASADSAGRLFVATDLGSLSFFAASSHSTLVWGSQPPGAQAYSAQTTASNGADLGIMMGVENHDFGGFYSVGSNGFTVPAGLGGVYLLTAAARFPSLHTGTRRTLYITKGADKRAESSVGTHNGAGDISLSVTHIDNAAAGAVYQVWCHQDSGGNLSVNSVYFSISKL